MQVFDRLQHAWNAFTNKDPTGSIQPSGYGSSYKPDRARFSMGNEKSIVTVIYNRIAVDVAMMDIVHVRLDENGKYAETLNTSLNSIFNLEANMDQSGFDFVKDAVISMFDEGAIAIVPVDTTESPLKTGGYEINSVRVARIIEWYPTMVKVRVYNDQTGLNEEVILPKSMVAIIENPFYSVMNEPNSTLKRLITKLNMLDAIDQQSSSGKLDIIIQLPYLIKTQAKKDQAEIRKQELEEQLAGSKYGIAYIDGTEKVTQLNRPAENNLMAQITYLTSMLYGQLGITEAILDGSADEKTMLNYYSRTVEVIVKAIVSECKRKFLTKTARTQKQTLMYFRDPFKLVPVNELAEVADKFTRNAIFSSNEIRGIMGYRPSSDPKANELSNKNLNQDTTTKKEAPPNEEKLKV